MTLRKPIKAILVFLVSAWLLCTLCFAAPQGFAGGSGTKADPYVIKTKDQLEYFGSQVNMGNDYSGKYIVLAADITLNSISGSNWKDSAVQWQSIGSRNNPFAGSFDGNGHTVSGLYINDNSMTYAGLFGYSNGDIRNLTVETSYICGGRYIGGICAYSNSGIIMGCISNTELVGSSGVSEYIGGICGYNKNGAVIDCINMGGITGQCSIGGICGVSMDSVYNCTNSGSIIAFGNCVGGICGWSFYSISGCINEAYVSAKSFMGGVCGVNCGTLTESRNIGSVTGNAYTGGVCGYSLPDAQITNSYNTGKVVGTGYTGGVCGLSYELITDCYNTSEITGSKNVGGICGSGRDITESYNVGAVSGSANIGGICGENYASLINICYNIGVVKGTEYIGGICGYNHSVVMNCYNTAKISGNTSIGGICGINAGGAIATSYNVGQVSGEYFAGAVIGSNAGDSIVKSNYYLEKTASDKANVNQYGIGHGAKGQWETDISGETAYLSDGDMKTSAAFAQFDFSSVWTMYGDSSYQYPELRNASYVSGITLNSEQIRFTEYKETKQLNVDVPFNMSLNTKIVWTSSNTKVATVDQTGLVTAVGTGQAIIKVALSDGSFWDSCIVNAAVPELTVSSLGGKPGEKIKLNISMANNPGFESITVKVKYDNTNITLSAAESSLTKLTFNDGILKWSSNGMYTQNGNLSALVFDIKDTARASDVKVELEVTSCTHNGEQVLWKVTGGIVKVSDFEKGDIDKNGIVDGRDVTKLLRHINDTEPLADTHLCDVNMDGKINIQDAVYLLNHVNGSQPFDN